MIPPVHARACCRWYIPNMARSVRALMRSPKSMPRTSSGRCPACMAGTITSVCHMSDLRLGHAAQVVTLGTDQPLDRCRPEPGLDRRLDEVHIRQLLVADAIARRGRGGPGGLADEQEQLDRHARPLGNLGERGAAERREPLEGGRVEEVERELPIPYRGAQAVQRDACRRQALHQPGAAQVAGREPVGRVRRENPQFDEPAQLVGAHPAAPRGLGQVIGLHEPTVIAREPANLAIGRAAQTRAHDRSLRVAVAGRGPERAPHRPVVRTRRACLEGRWSGRRGSNPRHSAWEADTLPTELLPLGRGHILANPRGHANGLADIRPSGTRDRFWVQRRAPRSPRARMWTLRTGRFEKTTRGPRP